MLDTDNRKRNKIHAYIRMMYSNQIIMNNYLIKFMSIILLIIVQYILLLAWHHIELLL